MELNETLYGFVLKEIRDMPEINAVLYRMEYEKTGTPMIWLKRDDENKTFAITFKTVPEDSTGIFHILEHSVLCGSDKYPVKEPFVELLKSSLQTFLNAMTFPDKTMYPVSSRNDQDFLNLIDVYMDAVLHPLSVRSPLAFRQEGWHYEFDEETDELSYNGVVYNEMKGAFSDHDDLMMSRMGTLLFPDTTYGVESGGDPAHIPELTYEQYKASHKRFYHPSNAYLFLDGDIELAPVLEKLDSFLNSYDRMEGFPEIALQAPVSPAPMTIPYDVGDEEDSDEDKAILALGFVYSRFDQKERMLMATALYSVLCATNESPLKKAVLASGLCKDFDYINVDSVQQPYLVLIADGVNPDKIDELKQFIFKTLAELADNGLDHRLLEALLTASEFLYREKDNGDTSVGIHNAICILNTWLYGGDPADSFMNDESFRILHRGLEDDSYERLLREMFLNNPHTAELILLPSTTCAAEESARVAAELAAVRAGWSQEEYEQKKAEAAELKEFQNREDTPEALATIPKVTLSDIPENLRPLRINVTEVEGHRVFTHDIPTGGIVYVNLYFDISDIPLEQLQYVQLLSSVFGHVPTAHYDPVELRIEMQRHVGRMVFDITYFYPNNDNTVCTPYVTVPFSVLEDQKYEAIRLYNEILDTTDFNDPDQIFHIIQQARISMEQDAAASSSPAFNRASAGYSAKGAVREHLNGLSLLRFLQDLENNFEERFETIRDTLTALAKRIYTRDRMTIGINGKFEPEYITALLNSRPEGPMGERVTYSMPRVEPTGIQVPSNVSYACLTGNMAPTDSALSAAGLIAGHILTYGYLWNTVRVKGGAYGVHFGAAAGGDLYFTSYRDPNAPGSVAAFRHAAQVLREFCDSDEPLDAHILSSLSTTDPLLTTRTEGSTSEVMYLCGRTNADRQKRYTSLLHMTKDELRAFADTIDRVVADSTVCIVGSKESLDACGDMLTCREVVAK